MAAKNMPITARQAMAIVGFTGLTEERVRSTWRTSGDASPLIGLAAEGDAVAVMNALEARGFFRDETELMGRIERRLPLPGLPRRRLASLRRKVPLRKRTRYGTPFSVPCRCSTSPSNMTF